MNEGRTKKRRQGGLCPSALKRAARVLGAPRTNAKRSTKYNPFQLVPGNPRKSRHRSATNTPCRADRPSPPWARASTLPDNRAFWESVNAVEFSSRGLTRQQVYRAVAYFVSLTDARVCFASVSTLAQRARLGTTATRSQLRALERDGYIETDGSRSGGRSATRYRLSTQRVSVPNPTLSVAQPNAERWVNPTLNVAEEVIEEGTKEVQDVRTVGLAPTETPRNRSVTESSHELASEGRRRLRSSPHTPQQRLVAAIASKLNLPALLTAAGLEEFDELENPKKQNLIKRLLKAEAWHDAKGGKRKKPTTVGHRSHRVGRRLPRGARGHVVFVGR